MSAVTLAYALAYLLIIAATFGPVVLVACVLVCLPAVVWRQWRRA